MIALARQVRRGERNDVVPGRCDDAAIERRRRKPIHVAVGMRAELRRRNETPTQEPQRQVRQSGATIRRRQQHDATELSRPSHRERASHDDGSHAVTDEMEPLDAGTSSSSLALSASRAPCASIDPRRLP